MKFKIPASRNPIAANFRHRHQVVQDKRSSTADRQAAREVSELMARDGNMTWDKVDARAALGDTMLDKMQFDPAKSNGTNYD